MIAMISLTGLPEELTVRKRNSETQIPPYNPKNKTIVEFFFSR